MTATKSTPKLLDPDPSNCLFTLLNLTKKKLLQSVSENDPNFIRKQIEMMSSYKSQMEQGVKTVSNYIVSLVHRKKSR